MKSESLLKTIVERAYVERLDAWQTAAVRIKHWLKEQQKGTLIGDYIRCFEEKNSPMEQKALYYGVQALMETKQ